MSSELLLAACSAGVIHTLAGPDHYLPLITAARAGSWSDRRTLVTTALCGLLHCASAFALLAVGVACTGGIATLADGETARSAMTSWILIATGAALLVMALRQHTRTLGAGLAWPFYLVFVLGPCEWMLPAGAAAWAEGGFVNALVVCALFAVATLLTMLVAVWVGGRGLARLPLHNQRAAMGLAGATTLGCGVAMTFGF